MHIPDGFINAPVSAGFGVIAAAGLGVSLKKTAEELLDRLTPLAGLVAAYVFAVQMLNFPVANGTSGHLLGGVLAAVLVGPWAAVICVSVVLFVQGLVFADGGLSAIGLNITNMALIGVPVGYLVFKLLVAAIPKSRVSFLIAVGIGAGLSVVAASIGFTLQYALGGEGGASVGTVGAAMVGVHFLIGIGEGIITALTVGVVLTLRPDLVHGAAHLRAPLTLKQQEA